MTEFLATGADHSEQDPRTVVYDTAIATSFVSGGVIYDFHEHQHGVGICTAISRVQLREKQTGKKYSPDFQYLLQKKYIDNDWWEGSSILSAMKVAKNYGFLPVEFWNYTTEQDRYLPYDQYIAKLQEVPDDMIRQLLNRCVDKIQGYAQVNVKDPQVMAKAINESTGGILCRYGCQKNWWTPSWNAKDINPLRNGTPTSGHAIINSYFDYSSGSSMQKLANTWGNGWCLQGNADINWDNYPPTEAWTDLNFTPTINQYPTIKMGAKGNVVKDLQNKLNLKINARLIVDGDFGLKTQKAVISFQQKNGLVADGICGKLTWNLLNN